ncbi:STP1 protein [Plasmodium ovale]|uniref:STP1 protein n=1 Tax=Plasmodium ovale TaxID=36330 RepID=A0A1D3JG55_PLAOA|nr:STP1 protein [Plasmodium ovale]
MADNLGYTTRTRDIPIGVFLAMITGDIKNLIRAYGHKNCGLRHKELCEEINKIIFEKKKIVFRHTDEPGKKKLISEWDSQRNRFFNKLFEEEGFINKCFPKKYPNNQSLNQLLSKHIKFCKEKDERLSTIGKSREYSVCLEYNKWIIAETASFTSEFLRNVNIYKIKPVTNYFSTKEHPQGHDPRRTYRNSKFDCEIYNPTSKSYQQIPVENTPKNSLHPPIVPDLDQKSRGKGGKSIPGGDGRTEKGKSDVKILQKTEPPASDSLTSSITNTKVDGTANGQHTDLKAKGTDSPNNNQDATGKPTETTDAKGQSPQKLSEPPSSISPKDSHVAKVLDPPLSAIKDQGTVSDSTLSSTSATSDTTHSIQNVPSPSDPDLSLPQSKPPALVTVPSQHQTEDTFQHKKEPTTPVPVIKSTDNGVSLISPLNPNSSLDSGLVSAPAAASNIGASATLSTTLSTTSASTAGPSTTTVSAMDTKSIPSITGIASTTDERGKPKASTKTVSDSPDTNFVSTRTQDNTIPPPINSQYPDVSLNMNQSPSQPLVTPPDPPLASHPGPPFVLSSGMSPEISPGVLPSSQVVVTRPDDKKIVTLPKKTSEQSKDSAQVTSTSLPEGTQRSGKPSITTTKFPPLTIIIPTFVIILATITLLTLLYKYTPIGLLLGRRRKRRKRNLRRIFEMPEVPTYESPNITVHEWEDPNLVGQIVENDVYIKLLKMKRYEQAIHKKKKKKKTTLIEVHMEVLEEYKSDEWELHKGDFLEICLRGFINEENDTYSKLSDSELTVKSTKNEKTIEDIQKQDILWNNWIENHRKILEQWKEKEWFHILKNKWRNEQQKYKEKNDKLQENILNEQEKHSIVSQKDIWKRWISKQATLIDMFSKEDWFKSMVYVQDKEKDNYPINEYNNISLTSKTGLKNEKMNHEQSRSKNIIQKLMVQIHMMVLEECIKEDIIKHKELCIDNFIKDIHNQNNYNEKRNITQCYADDINVLEFEEINTSRNK